MMVPSSMQSGSKKYQTHLNNLLASESQQQQQPQKMSTNLQSYSFDFRQ